MPIVPRSLWAVFRGLVLPAIVVMSGCGASSLRTFDARERGGLRGAFFAVHTGTPVAQIKQAVRHAAELGMDTIVVQTEAYRSQDGASALVPRDRIQAVLEEAEIHEIRVWLGLELAEYANGSPEAASDVSLLRELAQSGFRSCDRLLADFGSEPSFFGWYIPLEMWMPTDVHPLGYLPRYVSEVANYCHSRRAQPIAISPFISENGTDFGSALQVYAELFQSAPISVVVLQDGSGTWQDNDAREAAFDASAELIAEACRGACDLWVNVEAFTADGRHETPRPYESFRESLRQARRHTRSMVTYEFIGQFMEGGLRPTDLHRRYSDAVDP